MECNFDMVGWSEIDMVGWSEIDMIGRSEIYMVGWSEMRLADGSRLREQLTGYALFWKKKSENECRIHRFDSLRSRS